MRNLAAIMLPLLLLLNTSCTDAPEPPPAPTQKKMTVLIYAVASNSLSSFLASDKAEMLLAAKNIDLTKYDVLLYEILPPANGSNPSLNRIERNSDGLCYFNPIKTYDRSVFSTDPRRISEVIKDAQTLSKADNYGLVLWSHSTAWFSMGTRHDEAFPVAYAFGEDREYDKVDFIDVDELADTLPQGVFSFIWFDSCYMANIETLYEFRDTTPFTVASAMEVMADGMPYHLTLPYLASETPDLKAAANAFYDYYNKQIAPVSISVVDMSYMPQLAEACRAAYDNYTPISLSPLQNYSRMSEKLYDFGQYTHNMASQAGNDTDAFDAVMSKMMVYTDISEMDFNRRYLDKSLYSGLSCYAIRDRDTQREAFFKTLDWYKDAYPQK